MTEITRSMNWWTSQTQLDNGITAVPTFFSRNLYVQGCQSVEVLERFYLHLVKLREDDRQ